MAHILHITWVRPHLKSSALQFFSASRHVSVPSINNIDFAISKVKTYIFPLDISLRSAAEKLDVSSSTFSRLIKGDADVSPSMALKLSKAFGRSSESWMLMQAEHDLWNAKQRVDLKRVLVIYSSKHA